MGEQKINIGVMGAPALKDAIERQADIEGRSVSNLCERLLKWAMGQLEVAGGDSHKLITQTVTMPADPAKQTEIERRVYRKGTARSRKRGSAA
jgi:hypothetical protein